MLRHPTGAPAGRLASRSRLALLIVVVLVVALIAISTVVRLTAIEPHSAVGDGGQADSSPATTAPPRARDDDLVPASSLALPADGSVPPSSDPRAFATLVSRALFTWDTTTTEPGEVRGRLLAVADPTGEESPGLLFDLDGYLPNAPTWTQLAEYSTRQRLEITSAEIPAAWAAAIGGAPSSEVAPGTTAVTVTGIRHRYGVWEGDEVASQHDVAFTVFVVCAPTYPTCHVLRLSELDNPLR